MVQKARAPPQAGFLGEARFEFRARHGSPFVRPALWRKIRDDETTPIGSPSFYVGNGPARSESGGDRVPIRLGFEHPHDERQEGGTWDRLHQERRAGAFGFRLERHISACGDDDGREVGLREPTEVDEVQTVECGQTKIADQQRRSPFSEETFALLK